MSIPTRDSRNDSVVDPATMPSHMPAAPATARATAISAETRIWAPSQPTRLLSDIRGSTIEDSRPTTLSGFPAYRVSYRADLGSGELHFLVVWKVRGDKSWQMTYFSDFARYDAALPEVERLLTTLNLPA